MQPVNRSLLLLIVLAFLIFLNIYSLMDHHETLIVETSNCRESVVGSPASTNIVAMSTNSNIITPIDSFNPWTTPANVVWYEDPSKNGGLFNPSILALPPGSRYPFLMAGRRPHRVVKYDGEDYYESGIILCFMNYTSGVGTDQESRFQCSTEPVTLKIDEHAHQSSVRKEKRKDGNWYKFIGAEDPRVFWGPKGEPMLLYGMNTQSLDRLRSMWLVDLRKTFPELDGMLPESSTPHQPIHDQMELGLEQKGFDRIEKNWAAFVYGDELMLHSNMKPRKVYRLQGSPKETGNQPIAPVPLNNAKDLEQCFQSLFPRYANSQNNALHQATNILRLTLCNRGQCTPNADNTIYLKLFHVKDHAAYRYTQFAFTWAMKEGLPVRSLNGPMELPGHSMKTINFVTTINYLLEERSQGQDERHLGPDHGYLDSKVVLSFGVGDGSGKATLIYAHQLVAGETQCHS